MEDLVLSILCVFLTHFIFKKPYEISTIIKQPKDPVAKKKRT